MSFNIISLFDTVDLKKKWSFKREKFAFVTLLHKCILLSFSSDLWYVNLQSVQVNVSRWLSIFPKIHYQTEIIHLERQASTLTAMDKNGSHIIWPNPLLYSYFSEYERNCTDSCGYIYVLVMIFLETLGMDMIHENGNSE